LRSYVLHRLFSPPPPATTRFPFAARAEILERPTLLVPSGWDSWGKITAVKDGFDPGHIGEAWDLALSRHRKEIVGNDQREGEDNEEVDDLRDLWEEVVPFVDSGAEVRSRPTTL
jgi:dynein light intermediate chain 1